jgi:hypothetical protein
MEFRSPSWLGPLSLLLVSWVAVAALSLRLPADAEIAAVVFPPWWNAQHALSAAASADAAIIRTGFLPSILIVQFAPRHGLARLHSAGAWFAMSPQAVGGCSPQGQGAQ